MTDVAVAAGVTRLALFHHDPAHDDDALRAIECTQRARASALGSSVEIFAAAEGMAFGVLGKGWGKTVVDVSALERRPIAGGRVMIVTAHQADISALEQVLPEDKLLVMSVSDGRRALQTARASSPDLVILNSKLNDGDGASFIQPLRDALHKPNLPIILLTEGHGNEPLCTAEIVATDYLARPFSPPMLRTRVRAWLARTIGTTATPTPISLPPAAPEIRDERDERADENGHNLAQILRSIPLFASLTQEQRSQLMTQSIEQKFPADHTIIHQEDPVGMVYVILSGHVRVFESVPDTSIEMFLGELGPGQIFGELGVLRDRPRSATVVTLERTHGLAIPSEDFLNLLGESKEMSLAVLKILAGRLYDSDRLLARHAPDPVTGLPGRRAFHDLYEKLIAGSKRRGTSVLLLVFDVLHLKDINDRFGYSVGDDVLRTVADALIESSRTTDLVTRYGGDEFTVLLVEASAKDAEIVMSRVQQKLRQLTIYRNLPLTVECRMGYADSYNPPDTAEEFLRVADEDLQGKRSSQSK